MDRKEYYVRHWIIVTCLHYVMIFFYQGYIFFGLFFLGVPGAEAKSDYCSP